MLPSSHNLCLPHLRQLIVKQFFIMAVLLNCPAKLVMVVAVDVKLVIDRSVSDGAPPPSQDTKPNKKNKIRSL